MSSPAARLERFSDEEKNLLASYLKKRLLLRAIIYLALIVLSVFVVLYFNVYDISLVNEDSLGIINVVFVISGMLCLRLLIGEVMDNKKELNASSKKVIAAKVTSRDGAKIYFGAKGIRKKQLMIDPSGFDELKVGDVAHVELSVRSGMVFSVKKAS